MVCLALLLFYKLFLFFSTRLDIIKYIYTMAISKWWIAINKLIPKTVSLFHRDIDGNFGIIYY